MKLTSKAPRGKDPATPSVGDNKCMAQAARAIRRLDSGNTVEIGKQLQKIFDRCEHGQYLDWVARDTDYSAQTALNYRNVFELDRNPPRDPKNPTHLAFKSVRELDIALSALYLIAAMKADDQQPTRLAVIQAAKVGRVTHQMALQIVAEVEASIAAEATAKLAAEPVTEPAEPTVDPAWTAALEEMKAESEAEAASRPKPASKSEKAAKSNKPKSDTEPESKPDPQPDSKPVTATAVDSVDTGDPVALCHSLIAAIFTARTIRPVELVECIGLPKARVLDKFLKRGIEECSLKEAARLQADDATTAPPLATGYHSIKDAADRAEVRSKIAAFDDDMEPPLYLDRRKPPTLN